MSGTRDARHSENGGDQADAPQATQMCHVCESRAIVPFMSVGDNGHLRTSDVRLAVHRCRDCDAVFLNPPPPPSVGRSYFAHAYAGDAEENIYYKDEFKLRVSALRLDLIARLGKASGKLLDVGCGKGQFVHAAHARGWDAWGVELDEGACAYAREHYGLATVLNGSLRHPQLPGGFDVITLWDVIEHVPDPVGILRQAAERMAQGGLILVRTANVRSWAFDKHRSGWWAFGSDHRFYFSPGSLGTAMARSGLRAIDVINGELTERPDKRRSRDISETSLGEGLRNMSRSPAKVLKVGRYLQNTARRTVGQWRYGRHYHTSIMTVAGVKR